MSGWHSLWISYHGPQDRLVAEAVGPVLARLRESTPEVYFVRHWRRGPHVRLNVRCSQQVFDELVEPHVVAVVGEFLTRHPSTARIDVDRVMPIHRVLARDEREPGPLTPWLPDNSISRAGHDDRSGVLGEAEARMLERFSVRTTDLAVEMTRAVVDGASRSQMAFDLVAATAHALSGGGIGTGFVSLRSHSEAFLTYAPQGPELRDRWSSGYRERSGALRARLRAVVDDVSDGPDGGPGDGAPVPFVRPWLDELRPLQQEAARLVASGAMTLGVGSTGDPGRHAGPAADPSSGYHRWMSSTHEARAAVESSPWFLAYRWALNCTYVHLTRIGLAPVDRYRLCTWVADSVEEEYDVNAFDVARRILEEAR